MRTIGDAYAEGIIDTMALDLEMDPCAITEELIACGYPEEEAEALSLRPWASPDACPHCSEEDCLCERCPHCGGDCAGTCAGALGEW